MIWFSTYAGKININGNISEVEGGVKPADCNKLCIHNTISRANTVKLFKKI